VQKVGDLLRVFVLQQDARGMYRGGNFIDSGMGSSWWLLRHGICV